MTYKRDNFVGLVNDVFLRLCRRYVREAGVLELSDLRRHVCTTKEELQV